MARKKKDHRSFWAADCETDPFKYQRVPKPFIWGLFTGAAYHEFASIDEFCQCIRENDVIVYFHNGGKFDIHFLIEHLNLGEPVMNINGRLVSCNIGKAELRDSWNILPVKLADFGTKLDIDYDKLEEDRRHLHMDEIRAYLREDCVTLYNAIDDFERDYGRHLTQAGASMAQWKKISGLKAPKSSQKFFEQFSKYYYGGRVQTFQKGHIKGPAKVFDIRSAYPWAMLSEHPYEPEYVTFPKPKSIRPTSMVTVDCVSYGALPYRNERGGIVFPDDSERRRYYVPGHEILAALETHSLSRVEYVECIDFTTEVSFAPYIRFFYELRKQARIDERVSLVIFCKLLMNSLYGKFCANPENYGNFIVCHFEDMLKYKEEGYVFDGMLGPYALLKAPLEFWQENYLNVATGASITSQVRAKLWRAIAASDDPIYCDTDSLMCRGAELPLGDDLGQWNCEGEADDIWIAAKKLYYMEGRFEKGQTTKSASKGVNLKASDIRKRANLIKGDYGRLMQGGEKISGGEAIKLAATGEEVIFGNAAPTFSVSRKPTFQTRRIRAT